jgi:ATP-binding cassette, subfamily B, multidrug efflux pump
MLVSLLRSKLSKYKGLLVLVLVFQATQAFAGLYLPTLNADIIDNGVARGDTGYIWRIGGWMILISVAQLLFAVTAVRVGSRVAMAFGRDVRADLFHHVNHFSAREVAKFGAPSLITRITNDVQQVQMLVIMTCTLLLSAPFTAIGGVVLALRQDVSLSWIIAVSMPAVAILFAILIQKLIPTYRKIQEYLDRINEILREQLTGIRVVRAFVREPEEIERFREGNQDLTTTSLYSGRMQALMFPMINVLVNLSTVAVVWFGANRIASGEMKVGAMVAFISYLVQILMAVMMASFIAVMIPRAAVSADRIQEVLQTSSSVVIAENPVRALSQRAKIVMSDVGFAYPGAEQPVLRDVNVELGPGETLAVIGSTGAGKTTLVNLITRLFDVTEGSVTLDGVNVRDLDPHALWSRVGFVPQKPYLFSGTVASNLQFGKEDATEEEMWEALRIAQAEDFVRAMPGGLQARIVQGGVNVSGGQRQRLAIARALVRKPEVYIFDDSFSALDLTTEANLRAALAPFTRDAAVVIVGQRVSSIRNANKIMVLEDGAVVGLGTHDELLTSCATYEEIVHSQAMAAGAL